MYGQYGTAPSAPSGSPQYAAPSHYHQQPDYSSLLKGELVAASPTLSGVVAHEDLGVYVLHEAISLATNGDESQKQSSERMVQWSDEDFCDFATHVYEEGRYRHRGDPAYMSAQDPHRLLHLTQNCRKVQATLRKYSRERFDQLVRDVYLEHARRVLRMTDYRDVRHRAPTVEMMFEGVEKQNVLPFIRRLTTLAWKEGFQWQYGDDSTYSGLFTLYQLMIVATSEDRDKELYRYLISLQKWEAHIVLNAIQLLLDFSVHIEDGDTRMALLHALHRLASNSGLYPSVIEHQPVDTAGPRFILIGEGSFGQVFKVEHEGKVLALKVSRVDRNLEAKTFCKEVITWCNLSHDNVLPFYGVYFNPREGQYTLVSPFMAKGSVRKYLNENYPRVAGPRLLLVSDIASGLEYIHRMGVVHGDLKGDNILVSDSGRACLADFGISTVSTVTNQHLRLTLPSTAQMGTFAYQAPELLRCGERNTRLPLTEKSDVYAFGCVCYEIMTTRVPFDDYPTPASVVIAVEQGKRPEKPVSVHLAFANLGLTEALWELMEHCWLDEPNQRPKAEDIQKHPLLAGLHDPRPSHVESGELTAAQIRQNKVVISLRAIYNDPSMMSSMYTTGT